MYVATSHSPHVEAQGKPNKKSKSGGAREPVVALKDSTQLGCVSQDSRPRQCTPSELGTTG